MSVVNLSRQKPEQSILSLTEVATFNIYTSRKMLSKRVKMVSLALSEIRGLCSVCPDHCGDHSWIRSVLEVIAASSITIISQAVPPLLIPIDIRPHSNYIGNRTGSHVFCYTPRLLVSNTNFCIDCSHA
jgi:hypothetical protein